MQDIIPKNRRSIRDIPLDRKPMQPSVAPTNTPEPQETPYELPFEEDFTPTEKSSVFSRVGNVFDSTNGRGRFLKILLISALVLAVLVGLGGYALFYSTAKVTITPKTQAINITQAAVTLAGPNGTGDAHFAPISISETKQFTVAATGQETVNTKASGVITIYNNYSKASQKLIANTRFQSTTGKIYRIASAVTVPGQQTVGGKTVPGSIDVTVYADAAGESYNVSNTTFTIPGFAKDPRFSKFTASTKTAISGGFSGTRNKVVPADLTAKANQAVADLKTQLQSELGEKLASSSVALLTSYSVDDPTQSQGSSSAVSVTQKVTLNAITVDTATLTQIILNASNNSVDSKTVFIDDFSGLKWTLSKNISEPWLANTLDLTVSGNTVLIWYYNVEKLKEDLAGTRKKDLTLVLSKYSGISEAEASVSPVWRASFPSKPSQITVIEKR